MRYASLILYYITNYALTSSIEFASNGTVTADMPSKFDQYLAPAEEA